LNVLGYREALPEGTELKDDDLDSCYNEWTLVDCEKQSCLSPEVFDMFVTFHFLLTVVVQFTFKWC